MGLVAEAGWAGSNKRPWRKDRLTGRIRAIAEGRLALGRALARRREIQDGVGAFRELVGRPKQVAAG